MKELIVAADDFGLTNSVNAGIVKAMREGIVTALNLMPSGDAFDDAVFLAKSLDTKEIGAHLSLTECAPVSDPSKVPTLISKNGKFHKSYMGFFIKYISGKISTDEIYIELRAQLDRLKKAGVKPLSLSSHEHVHMMPSVLKIFGKVAAEYDIPTIRCVRSEPVILPISVKKMFKSLIGRYFADAETGADNFLGFLDSGSLNEDILAKMITSLKDGVTELVCHPGFIGPEVLDRYKFHLNCEDELFALTSKKIRKLIEEEKVELVGYSGLIRKKKIALKRVTNFF